MIRKAGRRIKKIKRKWRIERAWIACQPFIDSFSWPRERGKRADAGAVICLEIFRNGKGKTIFSKLEIPLLSFSREDMEKFLPEKTENGKYLEFILSSAIDCAIICVAARANDFLMKKKLNVSYSRYLRGEAEASYRYLARFNRGNPAGCAIKLENNSVKIWEKEPVSAGR